MASTSSTNLLSVQSHKSNRSLMSVQSHGYNMSFFGDPSFALAAKSKDELIEEVLQLQTKLEEMADHKLQIIKAYTKEIERLTSKLKVMEEKEQQSSNSKSKTRHKQRASMDLLE